MPLVNVAEVCNKSFDYIIVGGGSAGLALAARLSEDSSHSVLVLEAGHANLGDPKIESSTPHFGSLLGDERYDWSFSTVQQKYCNNREFTLSGGKGLGGSSIHSFHAWARPPRGDIDAFEKLGNPGRNWTDFQTVLKRSETFHPPSHEQNDRYPYTFDAGVRGDSGPVNVAIPPHVYAIDNLFRETLAKKGLKHIHDPYGGDTTGTWIASATFNPSTMSHTTSATEYLRPILERENLKVLTEAFVSCVIFHNSVHDNADLSASGVDFIHDGNSYVAKATAEVILCAGAIKSPQILELSGIGRPDVLNKFGVNVEIDLPGVGENVQEHTMIGIVFELNPKLPFETYHGVIDEDHPILGITSFAHIALAIANPSKAAAMIGELEDSVKRRQEGGILEPGLLEQLKLQIAALKNEATPDMEIVALPVIFPGPEYPEPKPGKNYVTFFGVWTHPVSRGSIHVKSKNPMVQPEIDPRYLESETDLEIHLEHLRHIRSLVEIEPLKSGVVCEVEPGPSCNSDSELREYIRNRLGSNYDTAGSCSMLPRNMNGVVDSQYKVYGTTNLRIADLSIIPLHIAAHPLATAYAIGEKVADFVKNAAKDT